MAFNMLRRVSFREFWHERKDWVQFVLILSMAAVVVVLGVRLHWTGLGQFAGPNIYGSASTSNDGRTEVATRDTLQRICILHDRLISSSKTKPPQNLFEFLELDSGRFASTANTSPDPKTEDASVRHQLMEALCTSDSVANKHELERLRIQVAALLVDPEARVMYLDRVVEVLHAGGKKENRLKELRSLCASVGQEL